MANVLLVEDNEALSEAFSTLLAHHGHRVTVASTLDQARRALLANTSANTSIDIAVIDYTLPDGEGIDLLGQPFSPEKAIILSGHSERSIRIAALARGASLVLLKPVTTARLVQAITNTLDHRVAITVPL